METYVPNERRGRRPWIAGIVGLIAILAIACGSSATSTPTVPPTSPSATETTETPAPTSTLTGTQPTSTPQEGGPTATPQPTATPGSVDTARDTITLVTNGSPDELGPWGAGCSGNVPSMACEELATDPLTWIDSESFEVVPLSGVESWQQIDPDRWRFFLREGVEFHDGEPFNAEAAKLAIDIHGDRETAGQGNGSFGFHGVISGEVVDEYTVDVVCDLDCPILPRTTIFLKFNSPAFWESASEAEKTRTTVGFGPYRIVEWVPDLEVELEAYKNYLPNTSYDSQAPAITRIFQQWRDEPLVRASMVQTGEADLAFEIGFENLANVPKSETGTNNEVFLLVPDTIWHPELQKQQVREALALSTNCAELMEALYDNLQQCYGNISQTGTVGITEENSAPYGYDPQRAEELLAEANYNPENEIVIYSRAGRTYRGVEMLESIIGSWQELGVNARLEIVEDSIATNIRRSGCGRYGSEARNCADFPPPGPDRDSVGHSTSFYESPSSNETLDYQRQLLLRVSCGNVNSRVCAEDIEEMTEDAITTPLGPERTRKLEELATLVHDRYYFLPMFQAVTAYGMAGDLEWTPRYDPRTRVNTMYFSE